MSQSQKYTVIVGNIGLVHEGNNPVEASSIYGEYKRQSKNNYGRAAGESVCVMKDDEILYTYDPPCETDF